MNLLWLIPICLVVVILVVFAGRYLTTTPDHAMIVTGARLKDGIKIIKSGGVFVWPILQKADFLSLQVQTLQVQTTEMFTCDGIPVTLEAVAQIKVKGNEESIAVAAEHFLGKPTEELGHAAIQSLQGYLRASLAQLTVDEVYKHREEFANKIRQITENDLRKMGLEIVTFTIKDVKDKTGYLGALGTPHIASIKRDAEIVKVNALRDEQVAKAKAMEESKKAEYTAETNIAEAVKEMEVKKLAFQLEQEIRKVEAEETMKLKELKMIHNVKSEEMTTQIMEKEKFNELEAKELERRENLETSLKKSTDAQKQQTLAELYQIENKGKAYALAIRLAEKGLEDKGMFNALIALSEDKQLQLVTEYVDTADDKKVINAHPSNNIDVRQITNKNNQIVHENNRRTEENQ